MADRPEQHRLGGRRLIASPASNSTSVGPQLSIEKRHVFLCLLWVGDVRGERRRIHINSASALSTFERCGVDHAERDFVHIAKAILQELAVNGYQIVKKGKV